MALNGDSLVMPSWLRNSPEAEASGLYLLRLWLCLWSLQLDLLQVFPRKMEPHFATMLCHCSVFLAGDLLVIVRMHSLLV